MSTSGDAFRPHPDFTPEPKMIHDCPPVVRLLRGEIEALVRRMGIAVV